jgi:hypothetical protein
MPEVPKLVVYALKAWAAGKASEGQQKLALSWVVFTLCRCTKNSFDPRNGAVDGRRVSDFVAGMQAVGNTLAHIIQTPVVGQKDQEIPSEAGIERPS